MATYSQIHQQWFPLLDDFAIRSSGNWVYPGGIYVRSGGSWVDIKDTAATGPRLLVRSGGLWVSLIGDDWTIEVCRTTPGTSLNEYTIPSSIFGLSVNKVVLRATSTRPMMWTKQYGGGVNFTHALTKNGSNVYALTGKYDDGLTCSDSIWSNRGGFTAGQIYYPGDRIGVKVTVPDTFGNDYGGTKVLLTAQWYFN